MREMDPRLWWAAAIAALTVFFLLRRQIVALIRGAAAWVRKRPPLGLLLWSVPLALLGVLVAWKGPGLQLASREVLLTPKEYLELQNSYRATIVQALGGIALLFGLYLTWRRLEIAGEGQITERFTRAIDQLGSEKLEVRLGGIYALERIARDSKRDHWPIMEVLTAYVRERSPAPEKSRDGEESDPKPVTPDIQAILTVVGRRRVEFDPPEQNLDLSGTNLSGAHLHRANLSGMDLCGANLSQAFLYEANLSWALLVEANLSKAIVLTREQIESAITDEKTILPDYLKDGES